MAEFTTVTPEMASSGILSVEEKRPTHNAERLGENAVLSLDGNAFSLCLHVSFLPCGVLPCSVYWKDQEMIKGKKKECECIKNVY